MVEYHGSDPSIGDHQRKFIRAGEKVYVTAPGDMTTEHRDLAIQDGVLDLMLRLREEDPNLVDAGKMGYEKRFDSVNLYGDSAGMDLPDPYATEARLQTVYVVQKENPTREVIAA